MKKQITIQELKSLIKEEAMKLNRRTLLESEKKKLIKELRAIGENTLGASEEFYSVSKEKDVQNITMNDLPVDKIKDISHQLRLNSSKLKKAINIVNKMGITSSEINKLMRLSPEQQLEYLKSSNLSESVSDGVAISAVANTGALGLELSGISPTFNLLFTGIPFVMGVVLAVIEYKKEKRERGY